MMGSRVDWAFGWEPWTAPALDELLPKLSREEQIRLQNYLREHERILKRQKKYFSPSPSRHTESERDAFIIPHARYALHHYNAKHPGEEFDAVKPLMESSVHFKDQEWFHVNFWARSRKSKKIKRFFAEVHYKPPGSISVCSDLPFPVPGAEKRPSSSSVCSDLPFPAPGAEKLPSGSSVRSDLPFTVTGAEKPSSSSSICLNLPFPVPGAEKPSSSSSVCSDLPFPVPKAEKPSSSCSVCSDLPFPLPIPIVEVCTILEEPLGRYRRSCAFCRGHLEILHPMGRKFVCGNDKDRIVQRLVLSGCTGLEMPFTCRLEDEED